MANDPVEALKTRLGLVFSGAQISHRHHHSRNAVAIEVRFPKVSGMDASSLSFRCPGWTFYAERAIMNESSAFLVDGPGMSGESLYVVFIPNDGSLRRSSPNWDNAADVVGLPRAPSPRPRRPCGTSSAEKTSFDRPLPRA